MTKKFSFGVITVTLAAVYALATGFHGKKIAGYVESEVAYLNDHIHNELGIRDMEVIYRQEKTGIFGSEYTIGVKYQNEQLDWFRQQVFHGPFPWDLLKQGYFAPVSHSSQLTLLDNKLSRGLFDLTGAKEPLTLSYRYGYNQKLHVDGYLAGFQYADDKLRFKLGDNRFSFTANRDFTDVDTVLYMGDTFIHDLSEKGKGVSINIEHDRAIYRYLRDDVKQELVSTVGFKSVDIKEQQQDIILFKGVNSTTQVDDDGKVVNSLMRSSFDQSLVKGGDVGQFSIDMGYLRLDSATIKQMTNQASRIIATLFKEGFKTGDARAADVEEMLKPYLVPLMVSSFGMFNQSPVVEYGPITHHNKGGSASVALNMDLLLPSFSRGGGNALSALAEDSDMVLSMLGRTELDLSFNREWADELLVTILTLMGKDDGRTVSAQDRAEIASITKDVEKVLLEEQLLVSTNKGLSLSVLLEPAKGKSLKTVEDITVNGSHLGLEVALMGFSVRMDKAEKRLEELEVLKRLDHLVERFR